MRRMAPRALTCSIVVTAVALLAPPATAKSFGPGDLRICDQERCLGITRPSVLPLLGAFYYHGRKPAEARSPQLGAPAFELRFRNGYVTGIVATRHLDRFLSYGVNIGHFRRRTWYRVPPRAAAELRRLSAGLQPLRVTRAAVARSR